MRATANIIGSRFPIKFLTVSVFLTAIVSSWMVYQIYQINTAENSIKKRQETLVRLREEILYLDEVLTMSAHMAAATGDSIWEGRYRQYEPELDKAIQESIKLAPNTFEGKQAFITNKKLVAIETQAFELIRQGKSEDAKILLFGPEYKKQKKIYIEGMVKFAESKRPSLHLIELRGMILRLDETLTMSARMAATTGDLKWEERYLRFVPQLDEAIQKAIELAPSAYKGAQAKLTDSANQELVAMETQAFELIHNGKREDAKSILFGPKYKKQKKIYSNGMEHFSKNLEKTIETTLSNRKKKILKTTSLVIGLSFIMLISWFFSIRTVNTWRKELNAAHEGLEGFAEELKTKNYQLERQHERLNDFTRIASHDLKAPLRKISMLGEMLQEDCGDNISEDGNNYIAEMCKTSVSMKTLIDDLLTYSKVEQVETITKTIDLNLLLNKLLNSLSNIILESEATINVESLPMIKGHTILWQQLFQNLIENSLKYRMKERNPIIDIQSKKQKDLIEISISDNGIGFPQEQAEKIFKPFTRLVHKSEYEGSGIGLATVKKIVDKYNGTIQVTSELGQGTTFTITIPTIS